MHEPTLLLVSDRRRALPTHFRVFGETLLRSRHGGSDVALLYLMGRAHRQAIRGIDEAPLDGHHLPARVAAVLELDELG